MKQFKHILLLFVALIFLAALYNYPKLNIISGFASKNLASTSYISKRSFDDISKNDNNIPLIRWAKTEHTSNNNVITSVFGFMKRETICRPGLGCVLINEEYDKSQVNQVPKRTLLKNGLPFPYGNNGKKDTVFNTIDYAKLNAAIENITSNYELQKTRTAIVVYKGHIVAEYYMDGFSENTPILGWSMTKSLLATLFGILEYQGKISMNYRPFNELDLSEKKGNDPRAAITLDEFLRMSSGLAWNEDYTSISDVTKMLFLEADMTKSQINTAFDANAPKVWNYSSGTTNFLSGVLRAQFSTHNEYLDFPYLELIDKIGMHSMVLETDMAGNFVGSSYGWATTRDWAKFGLLHLYKGNWNGEQLFNPQWIDYITRPTPGSDGKYGAHWWLNSSGKYPDAPRDLYSANGFQGQYVYIIPSKELVIVRTGLAEAPDFDENNFLKQILKAFK